MVLTPPKKILIRLGENKSRSQGWSFCDVDDASLDFPENSLPPVKMPIGTKPELVSQLYQTA